MNWYNVNKYTLKTAFLVAFTLTLSACDEQAEMIFQQHLSLDNNAIESIQLLPLQSPVADADRLISYAKTGLNIEDKQGNSLAQLSGQFGQIDYRLTKEGLVVIAEDQQRQQVMLSQYHSPTGWQAPIYLAKTSFKVEGVCLYQDPADNIFAFLVGEEGRGQQWLVADNQTLLKKPALVRDMSMPPASEYCQVNDEQALMFINEEQVGIWAYPASPEADLNRQAVAMLQPFGEIYQSAAGMAIVDHSLFVSDPEHGTIQLFEQQGAWSLTQQFDISSLSDAENLSVRVNNDSLDIAIIHDDGVTLYSLDWQGSTKQHTQPTAIVQATVETTPVPSMGDAADDPAIWINAQDPQRSLVLGTDKKAGLAVYDLQGQQQQYLAVGRLNNVDVRSGFSLANQLVDLAIASNRDHNSLHLFTIDPGSGFVTEAGEIKTEANDIYGLCMYKDAKNRFYAIANDKDGRFLQYEITANGSQLAGTLRRQFSVASQPEGCVADEQNHSLFIGEEGAAVWRVDADVDAKAELSLVAKAGDKLTADIEGMSIYNNGTSSYLVVSSQGNNRYVLFETQPPYSYIGSFQVGLNVAKGIDGASETDGLTVTSHDLGGEMQQGMLVVQDGRNRFPETNQNYKYIPWADIAAALDLNN